ncbi:MAG TPA: hypothetical protein VL383_09015 [Gemmatimonadaceae bacterium]|nr:hypothetical protein [Gemmatimonadaceae bacterium]
MVSLVGLGLIAGAVLHGPLAAQVKDTIQKKRDTTLTIPVPPHADSLLRDSLAKRDSIKRAALIADSVKAPIAHSELPTELSIGRRLHWNRDSLFATGAVTLADLLERVPGLTTLHAGWIAAPAIGAYLGDTRRVRVFYDGFEYGALDPRSGGSLDLTQLNLWSVEDAVIEQAADEVRVYLRSWRSRTVTPETRTDVSTGDQQTNMYRGYFGKRWHGGGDFQFGAQQYGTAPPRRFGSSSDQTGVIGRVGWSRPGFSVDGYLTRIGRHRGVIIGETPSGDAGDSIPTVGSTRTDMYLRAAYGDPDTSLLWLQVMAVGSKYDYTGVRTRIINNPVTPQDSALAKASLDTSIYRSQYVASVGSVRGPLQLSANARMFASGGKTLVVPSLRASFLTGPLSVTGFLDTKSVDSVAHTDVTARFTPLSFVSLLGGVGRTTDSHPPSTGFETKYARGEVGLRVKNLWLIGGLLHRDSARLAPARIFDTLYAPHTSPAVTAYTAAIRGQLWRLIHADISALKWTDTAGSYRPQYQTRSELFVRTNLLDRFPTGDFGLTAALIHEYRSGIHLPVRGETEGRTTIGYRTLSTLLEIRILSATISWQFRNTLGERYAQVPGFIMPRQTNFYGVRWSFVD